MMQKIPPFARQWSGEAINVFSAWADKSRQELEELAREQNRAETERQMRNELGIPENNLENAIKALIDAFGRSKDMFAQIKKLTKQMRCEPHIKVSPYVMFDKYRKKKRK